MPFVLVPPGTTPTPPDSQLGSVYQPAEAPPTHVPGGPLPALGAEVVANKGRPGGYTPLGDDGLVPLDLLPPDPSVGALAATVAALSATVAALQTTGTGQPLDAALTEDGLPLLLGQGGYLEF